MMQVIATVEGSTYAELEFKAEQAIQSFMTGAPSGTTYTVDDVGRAEKVSDKPAGWDVATATVITLPVYRVTRRWNITTS